MKVVAGVVGLDVAAAARERLRAQYTRYRLVDRGSYDFADAPDDPALLARAGELAGASRLIASRALRLVAGDYLLLHHDRARDDRTIEVVLDLSPAPVPGAEVHYRHRGQVFFVFPTTPGDAAIVERGPTVMCNHTYVSKLHPSAEVVRLVYLFSA